MPFIDRKDAGRKLATRLEARRGQDLLVLGIARGGLPIAHEVADALGAPLDAMIVRKLGAPRQPELGIGAIAPGDIIVVDEHLCAALGVSRDDLDAIVREERLELERRLMAYRGEPGLPDVKGKTVILVDDGIATGGTVRAAIAALRAGNAGEIVLATPVCAADTAETLRDQVDDFVCLETPAMFIAVGKWYRRFDQTSDDQVISILERHRKQSASDAPHARPATQQVTLTKPVRIPVENAWLDADLTIPRDARVLVIFAHGSGSSRRSTRNRAVARRLNEGGLATLLLDLLTENEEAADAYSRAFRFDIPLLATRLVAATDWACQEAETRDLSLVYFGSSTGAAAALIAAADRPENVRAVISRGGRPDLANARLPDVRAHTLLIVGGRDKDVLQMNKDAFARIQAPRSLRVIDGATHLFEEPGALEQVADLAARWAIDHGTPARGASKPA